MAAIKKGKYYSGTSGLVLPVRNKSFYPPEFQNQSRLTFYGSLFSSIEINSSFYKMPRLATTQKWADTVPKGFHFTFKLSKEITHVKSLAFDPEAVVMFMKNIEIPDEKKGCLLVQFPPGLKYISRHQFQSLVTVIRTYDSRMTWKISFEFRDRSWYREELFRILEENNCGMVFHDMASSQPPMDDTSADHIYLRFHGPEGNYRGSYEDHFLREYATYITEWLYDGKDVYVYFNNTMGDAIRNLMTLNKYIIEGNVISP